MILVLTSERHLLDNIAVDLCPIYLWLKEWNEGLVAFGTHLHLVLKMLINAADSARSTRDWAMFGCPKIVIFPAGWLFLSVMERKVFVLFCFGVLHTRKLPPSSNRT
jgi:hypothetical protein